MLANSFPRRWIPSVLFKGLAKFRTPLLTMLATPLKGSAVHAYQETHDSTPRFEAVKHYGTVGNVAMFVNTLVYYTGDI